MRASLIAMLCAGFLGADEAHLLGGSLYGRDRPSQIVTDFQLLGLPFPGTRTTTTFTYDQHGQVLLELVEMDAGPDGAIDSRISTAYTYDARGNVVLQVREPDFFADGVADETVTTGSTYNARGLQLTEVSRTTRPFSTLVTVSSSRFAYNAKGDRTAEVNELSSDFDPAIDRTSTITYRYNRRHQLASRHEVVIDDLTSSPLVFFEAYLYDQRSNLVRTRMTTDFGGDGTIDSVVVTTETFDERGQNVGQVTRFDLNGDGLPDTVRNLVFTYDARGALLTRTDTWDEAGDGSVEQTTATTFTYDTAGRLLSETVERDLSGDGLPDDRSISQYFY